MDPRVATGLGAEGKEGSGLQGQRKEQRLGGKPQTAGYKMPNAELFQIFFTFLLNIK